MRVRPRGTAAAVLAALGIGMLAWGVFPPDRTIRTVHRPPIAAVEMARALAPQKLDFPATEPETYLVVLQYPRYLRLADADVVELRVTRGNPWQGEVHDYPRVAATAEPLISEQQVREGNILQARLELEGAEVRPAGEITAAWAPGQGASFVWAIHARGVDPLTGTAWLFLVLDAGAGFSGERAAVSAMPVQLTARTFLGLSGPASRVIGSALILLATLVGLPGIDNAVRSGAR